MLRSIPVILLFLTSLLSIFPAPTYHLWLLAVTVTEYAWIFILLSIILLLSGLWLFNYPLLTMVTGVIALALFASPILRASVTGSGLKQDMQAAFGDGAPENKPFSFCSLINRNKTGSYQSIEYKKLSTGPLSLDFYPSEAGGNRPCVVVIHGGSWSSGDSRQLPELNAYLAKSGYTVASLNYRKAPDYRNPAPVEDVKDAMAVLRTRAGELQIDTNNFVLLGRSAGGQIALLAAYTFNDSSIKGVIDFYGPADMVWGYSVPSNPWVMDSRGVMERYLGGTYSRVPENYEASSPILFVNKKSPPTLMIHGDNDVLVSPLHSVKLDDELQKNGVKHYLLRLPWGVHGFDYNLNGPGGQLSTYAVTYFLRSVTR